MNEDKNQGQNAWRYLALQRSLHKCSNSPQCTLQSSSPQIARAISAEGRYVPAGVPLRGKLKEFQSDIDASLLHDRRQEQLVVHLVVLDTLAFGDHLVDLCAAEWLAHVLHEVAEDFAADFALSLRIERLEELLQVG